MRLWWWARLDSNQEPTDYEPDALTIELRARALTISEAETHCTMPAVNFSRWSTISRRSPRAALQPSPIALFPMPISRCRPPISRRLLCAILRPSLKHEPVHFVFLSGGAPVLKITRKHRAKFRIERPASARPSVTVHHFKSISNRQAQPVRFQN